MGTGSWVSQPALCERTGRLHSQDMVQRRRALASGLPEPPAFVESLRFNRAFREQGSQRARVLELQ
jgi:hypothetical protein